MSSSCWYLEIGNKETKNGVNDCGFNKKDATSLENSKKQPTVYDVK